MTHEDHPDSPSPLGGPNGPVWEKSRRGHALASLVEISNQFGKSRDVFETGEFFLLALMGQLGASRGALWMDAASRAHPASLIVSHGISRPLARAVVAASTESLRDRSRKSAAPLVLAEESGWRAHLFARLASEAGLSILATSPAHRQRLVFVGLGGTGAQRYATDLEMAVLESSMSLAGLAFAQLDESNAFLEANRQLRSRMNDSRDLENLQSRAMTQAARALLSANEILRGCFEQIEDRSGHAVRGALEAAHAVVHNIERIAAHIILPPDRMSLGVRHGPVDIRPLLATVIRERMPGASCDRCELVFEGGADPVLARIHEHALTRLVHGVLDARMVAAVPGARIVVSVEPGPADDSRVRVHIKTEDRAAGHETVDDAPLEPLVQSPDMRQLAAELGVEVLTNGEPWWGVVTLVLPHAQPGAAGDARPDAADEGLGPAPPDGMSRAA
jgi:hypothetical protein